MLALVLTPVVHSTPPPMTSVLAFGVVAARELIIGLSMGFTSMLAFGTFQVAGELIGRQMGFAIGQTADPLYNQHSSTLSQVHYTLAMLMFLSINGHHWFLQALGASFHNIPLGEASIAASVSEGILERFVAVFTTGVKMAAPAICVLVLVTIGLGMLARAAPQLNMLMISISLRIVVGLGIVGILLPYVYQYGKVLLRGLQADLAQLVKAL
jgi:flagellar biosynthetic protein FliR